jgi:hypothetical protein
MLPISDARFTGTVIPIYGLSQWQNPALIRHPNGTQAANKKRSGGANIWLKSKLTVRIATSISSAMKAIAGCKLIARRANNCF